VILQSYLSNTNFVGEGIDLIHEIIQTENIIKDIVAQFEKIMHETKHSSNLWML